MKFTIDTTTKIIEVSSAGITEIETIKKAIEAMGLNPIEFSIVSGVQYYPQYYPQVQPYNYPPLIGDNIQYTTGDNISN